MCYSKHYSKEGGKTLDDILKQKLGNICNPGYPMDTIVG